MNIRNIAKSLLAPSIFYFLNKILIIKYAKKYSSYKEALIDSSINGYETDDVVRVVVEKNKRFRYDLVNSRLINLGSRRTLIGLGLCKNKNLNVLDYGGGEGISLSNC